MDILRVSSDRWRAVSIYLGTEGQDVPGLVCLLSGGMSSKGISILNMSTYDADYLFVREADVDLASQRLVNMMRRGVHGIKEKMESPENFDLDSFVKAAMSGEREDSAGMTMESEARSPVAKPTDLMLGVTVKVLPLRLFVATIEVPAISALIRTLALYHTPIVPKGFGASAGDAASM